MDKIKKYQKLILNILRPYCDVKYENLDAENKLIADKQNHRYQVVTIGWDEAGKFIHDCPIHVDIINGKIWIQNNMTEIDIGKELTDKRVPHSDIVLGFFSPKMREYTDDAVT
jgi:XisI protein